MRSKHISDILETSMSSIAIKTLADLIEKNDRLNQITQTMQTQIFDLESEIDRLKQEMHLKRGKYE